VQGERCALTNSPWIVDGPELRARFGLTRIGLVNDFEAIAHALPYLGETDLYPLGSGTQAVIGAPMAVLGPGTGLGVAALVPHGDEMIAIASEAGHSTLPATSPRESAVIAHLCRQFGHVSAERVLSGAGLENLYLAISALDRAAAPAAPLRTAAEITQAAVAGTCPTSEAALDMFCGMLGTVAGNIALSFGARGGVFVAGGILPRLGDYVARSQFRKRFEGKGRLRPYLEPIPVSVILNTDAAFLGLRSLACPPSTDAQSATPLGVGEAAPRGTALLSSASTSGRVAASLAEDRESAKR
jgi:glucokinase